MIAFSRTMTLATAVLLTACGGDVPEPIHTSIQLASTTMVAEPAATQQAVVAAPVMSPEAFSAIAPETNTSYDGMWECLAGNGQSGAMELEVNGNILRHTISNTTMVLTHDKGIDVGTQLVSYRDQETGQLMYVPVMTQVDKPGYASAYFPASSGGPEAGIELTLNPNDTIAITDYSSMAGAGSVGRPVPMTCRRMRR